MGSSGDNTKNSSQVKSRTSTVSKNLNKKKIKRSVSSNCIANRPWTRSLTRAIDSFSFCSIPLRKTTKNLAFKLSKHLNDIMNKESRINIDNMEVNSQESILVLYGPESSIFSSTDEIPRDLRDIKLDPFTTEYYTLDLRESTVYTDNDHVVLEQKPENYKFDSNHTVVNTAFDINDVDDHQEFILIDPMEDLSLATMINLYETRGDSEKKLTNETISNGTSEVNGEEDKIVKDEVKNEE